MKFVELDRHRLYVCDEDAKLKGIVTLTDVMKWALKEIQLEEAGPAVPATA